MLAFLYCGEIVKNSIIIVLKFNGNANSNVKCDPKVHEKCTVQWGAKTLLLTDSIKHRPYVEFARQISVGDFQT